jgi:hypothetical protein
MDFNILDYLIYSSHKTSTQSLIAIFFRNNKKSVHCHCINDFKITLYTYRVPKEQILNGFIEYKYINNKNKISSDPLIEGLVNYQHIHNKKIKIISVIRNPIHRLLSSFFHIYHDDEKWALDITNDKTTISTKSEEELCELYTNLVKTGSISGESLDELSQIFGINIIDHLEKKNNYYYLNHDLFELYVLDFNKIISSDCLLYLNKILNTNFTILDFANLSSDKTYYTKYKNVKTRIGTSLDETIKQYFNPFYFNAF